MDKKNIEDIFALTPMQEGMLFHNLKAPTNEYYFEQLSLEITGEIDAEIFKKAWNFVIGTNEMLRAVFRWENIENPIQIILKEHQFQSRYYDFSHGASHQIQKRLEKVKVKDRKERFDLREVPFRVTLFKLEKAKYVMMISNHHILYDGWSNGIILKEFFKAYDDLCNERKLVKPVKTKFKKFVKWNQDQDIEIQEKFWRDYLKGFDTQTELSIKRRKKKEITTFSTGSFKVSFSRDLKNKIENFVKNHNITLASFLYSVWGLLSQKYNNTDDVIFGTTVSGRNAKVQGIEEIVGLFINTLPFRVQTNSNEKTVDFLYRIDKELQMREACETTSLVKIKEYSEIDNKEELFDSIVIIENYPLDISLKEENSKLSVNSYTMVESTHYVLTVGITVFDDIEIIFTYEKEVLDETSIVILANHYQRIVENTIKAPGKKAFDIEIISGEEKNRILYEFNDTESDYPKHKTIHRLFAEQVESAADRIAAVFEEKQLTYRELNKKSHQLAHLLRTKGVKPDTIVGIKIERSIEMIIGIMGILKAGGAYLPIDPDYPQERIDFMINDSGVKIVLTADELSDCVRNRLAGSVNTTLLPTSRSSNTAYAIYTSGSTGKPKGVIVEHHSVVNLIMSRKERFDINITSRILLVFSISFDASVEALFSALSFGGALAVVDKQTILDMTLFETFICRHSITIMSTVPSILALLSMKGGSSLKQITTGGEPCPISLADSWHVRCNLYNEYGPTEAAVTAVETKIEQIDKNTHRLPLGKPIPNVMVYVVNSWMRLVPPLVVGELVIGGKGLARGYLNRPELTAEKFINPSPFTHNPSPIYKTGDLARWLPDGNIEFLGRIDRQVKIRGFRIELGEIETRLMACEEIKEAVVVDKEDKNREKYLCAYIVPRKELATVELREYLSENLPDFMIPSYFINLEKIPLTPNGKIDKKALPLPGLGPDENYTAPRNEIEKKLARIWAEVLKVEPGKIGIYSSFSGLGGDSIKIMRINAKINKIFAREISLENFIKAGTIERLAEYISKEELSRCIKYPSAVPDPANIYEPFPLTEVQMAYLLGRSDHIEMGGVSTHAYREYRGQLDIERFNLSLNRVIARHPMMRAIITGDGYQRILEDVNGYRVEVEDITRMGPGAREQRIAKERERMSHYIFKTDQWPLFEIKAFKFSQDTFHFCIGLDPLIADASSTMTIAGELGRYYENPRLELPALELTFRDYMMAYQELKKSPIAARDREYWLAQLEDFPPAPALPFTCNPAKIKEPHFKMHKKVYDRSSWKALREIAGRNNITPSALLCTAYVEVLSYWSNQQRLAVNLTVFNRYPFHKDVEHIVGDFTSLVLLGIELKPGATFWERARQVRDRLFAGLEHRHYDGVEFIRELAGHRGAVNKAIMPIVFTSALFDENNQPDGRGREEPRQTILNLMDELGFENVTQTSQVYLDNAVSEINGRLIVNWSYVEDIFDSRLINAMFQQYTAILTHLARGDYKESHSFALPAADKPLLEAYDKTGTAMTRTPLHRLFTRQVRLNPDHTALIFGNRHLTYKELDNRANRVAGYLRRQGVGRYDPVGVLTPRRPETIIDVIGILKSGGAYVPIETDYPEERRNYILANSHCKLFLEPGTVEHENPVPYPGDVNINETENRDEQLLEDLAYVIYTSGSTGRPKGVMITHGQAVNTIIDINRKFRVNSRDRLIAISSMCFDLSVYDVFGALSTGAALVLIPNQRDIDNIIEVMEKYAVTTWNSVPAVMDLVVNTMEESSFGITPLRLVLLSGDWIPLNLPGKITRYFPGAEVISLGGATEGSIWSIYYPVTAVKNNWNSIPYGYPLANQRMYVLNYRLQRCPAGVPGEIYIGGTGVAEGYLNDQEKTAASFLYHKQWGKIYRTGDHGVFHPDGHIEFLGRKDHQVKIGGFRIELGEIQGQLLKHPGVKEALVTALEKVPGNKSLCAYLVLEQNTGIDSEAPSSPAGFDPAQFKEYLSQTLPVYMIPSYFVRIEHIPLTPNGKIDRSALPEPGIPVIGSITLPGDELEKKMAGIWSEVLGIEKERIDRDANFFDLGGHSLKVSLLTAKIHKELAVKVPLVEVFERNTIRALSGYVKNKTKARYTNLEALEKKEYYALSSAQKRIYFLQKMYARGTAYNIPAVLPLEKNIDKGKLEKALKKLAARHESLRTSFESVNEQPVQKIHQVDTVDCSMDYYETDETGIKEIFKNYIRPFDLSQAPLTRFAAGKLPGGQAICMLDMHHIVSDGTSQIILFEDFRALYNEEELEPLEYQYKDFTQWQNRRFESGEIKVQEDYWMNLLADAGSIPGMRLPRDFKRPEVFTFAGDVYKAVLEREAVLKLKRLGHQHNATLYMSLLAILNILFYKYTGQEDILIGSAVAGRSNADIQQIVGMFVNTLVLRNRPMGEKPYDSFLKEVTANTIDALENQDFQFEELVDKLDLERDLSRNPLFDVFMLVQNFSKTGQKSSTKDNLGRVQAGVLPTLDENFSSIKYRNPTSKFDITFFVYEQAEDIYLNVEYYTAIFKPATIERLISRLQNIIGIVIEEHSIKLKDIEIINEEEKRRILFQWNDTARNYPRDKRLHEIFEEQVERTPDRVAVVGARQLTGGNNAALTYRELNKKSNRLAGVLKEKGVEQDSIVGIAADRTIAMITGIIGILKAGGAYLPIDPAQPGKRTGYMLTDSGAVLLLSAGIKHLKNAAAFNGACVDIDDDVDYNGEGKNTAGTGTPANVVYAIYTSGTSGKPKGALIENKNLLNYVCWFSRKVRLTARDRSVLTSSFSFDLGYTAIYPPILTGGQLHIVPREIYISPEDLIHYIRDHRITYLKLTPSLFSIIVESPAFSAETCRTLRLIALGGEEIKLKDVEKAHGIAPHMEIMNHYGPTEATIGCVARSIDFNRFDDYKNKPTIGKPIDNMKVYILDKGLKPVVPGAAGELCISGVGLARGYLNRPLLTAERFPLHAPLEGNRLYRTGDMASWLPGGKVRFLGRIDSQVKIRGYRIEIGEIENRILTRKAIKDAVVILRTYPSGDPRLCAYIVLNPTNEGLKPAELNEYLAQTLPDYMIPSYIVKLEKIPLTLNGKVDMKALPPPAFIEGEKYTAPRDKTEEKLAALWSEVLEIEKNLVGMDANFFQMGGHSLKATILVSRIHKEFNVKVPLLEVFKKPGIKELAKYIKSLTGDKYTAIKPVEKKDYYELSPAQKRLFIQHHTQKNNVSYNTMRTVMLEGNLKKERLEEIFNRLIQRHENLRTSFEMTGAQPIQKIHHDTDFVLEYHEGTGPEVEKLVKNFVQPFDLNTVPLLRVRLVKLLQKGKEDRYLLLIDMHHIITDGTSAGIIVKELMALYAGEELPPPRIQYKDFSEWQDKEKEIEILKKQKAYWLKEFEHTVPVLNLPTDYVRPETLSHEGSTAGFELDREKTKLLNHMAIEAGATLYIVLLAIFNVLLSKECDQEDILIGVPVAGRRHADLYSLIGFFVNMLALRNFPEEEKTFREFLPEVKEKTLNAYENQDYPFEDLVDDLLFAREANRHSLIDAVFVFQNAEMPAGEIPELEIPGLKLIPYELQVNFSPFDLILRGYEADEKLILLFQYKTALFKEETIQMFIRNFKEVVSSVIENKTIQLKDIDISDDLLTVKSNTLAEDRGDFDFLEK